MDRSVARGLIYNTLSLCYVYPDEEVFTWLAGKEWVEELKGVSRFLAEESLECHLSAIGDLLNGEHEGLSLELRREYTRLFINGFPQVVAPPYGSVYLEKTGLVFGETTSEVLRFYHEAGFTMKGDLHDLPDHIAHELEFMGILANQESQATGGEKIRLEEVQMAFFSRFLLPWISPFSGRVADHSRLPFYRHLALLTDDFIDFEKNYLGIPEELNSKTEEVEHGKTICNGDRS